MAAQSPLSIVRLVVTSSTTVQSTIVSPIHNQQWVYCNVRGQSGSGLSVRLSVNRSGLGSLASPSVMPVHRHCPMSLAAESTNLLGPRQAVHRPAGVNNGHVRPTVVRTVRGCPGWLGSGLSMFKATGQSTVHNKVRLPLGLSVTMSSCTWAPNWATHNAHTTCPLGQGSSLATGWLGPQPQ